MRLGAARKTFRFIEFRPDSGLSELCDD